MVDAQTIGVLVTAASVTVAAVYYVLTLRTNQRNIKTTLETRQAQLFMNIYNTTYSKDWANVTDVIFTINMKNYQDWANLRKDKEKWLAMSMVGQWLEGIGVLVREGLVNVRMVSELNSGLIKWYWEAFGDGFIDVREKTSFPRFMIETQYLYDRVMDYAVAHPELKIETPRGWEVGFSKSK
ncbi:MAG: hypothetical protein ABSA11_17330 [Candidatus Bathyarchaeia archaeon]|jgi:hypothetical protein